MGQYISVHRSFSLCRWQVGHIGLPIGFLNVAPADGYAPFVAAFRPPASPAAARAPRAATCRAAKQRYELAAIHSITSSAVRAREQRRRHIESERGTRAV